jgi:hypothetical protein
MTTTPKYKDAKERAFKIGLLTRVWAQLASLPKSTVHASELSLFLSGGALSVEKQERVFDALTDVEDLCNSTVVKVDLSDAANVRAAIARLAEVRRNPAQAPWKFRGVEVPHDAAPLDSVRNALATPGEAE